MRSVVFTVNLLFCPQNAFPVGAVSCHYCKPF
uniref:Uncharacterized protein n=1 Tax=Anguilla anguilla TaxID=7936 RepID=A0A0E9VQ07_ANGAN